MSNIIQLPQNPRSKRMQPAQTVLVAGGSGYVGRSVIRRLLNSGHRVMLSTRRPSHTMQQPDLPLHPNLAVVNAFSSQSLPWQPTAVINLCGANIAQKRWSEKRKQELLSSRLESSEHLIVRCKRDWPLVRTFISASAVGIYGEGRHAMLTEQSPKGEGFGAELCQRWEDSLNALPINVRQVQLRLGVVISAPRKGSALGRMLPAYRAGLGAQIGDGKHWMAWIHRDDASRLFEYALDNVTMRGAYNACTQNPITYKQLHKQLGSTLRRPAIFKAPGFLLRLMLGEMSELLLQSQRVIPIRTLAAGFHFNYPNFAPALAEALDQGNNRLIATSATVQPRVETDKPPMNLVSGS